MSDFLNHIKDNIKRKVGKPTRISLFQKFIPKHGIGAELGVFKGEFSEQILRYNQPSKLYLIDGWWTIYGESYPNWGRYTDYGNLRTRTAFNHVNRMIQKYPDTITKILVGNDRAILPTFDNHYFDWVYIDTSHQYDHTMEELLILSNKVKHNGLICGHDWIEDPNNMHYGVYKAINEFCRLKNYQIVFKDEFTQWVIQRKDG